MIQVNWPAGVNTKFFSGKREAKENIEITENLSGRVIGHRINSKDIMIISCSLRMSKEEQKIFWNWFNNTLCQTAGFFYCPELGTDSNQLYRFTSIPTCEDTNQTVNDFSMEIEEAF